MNNNDLARELQKIRDVLAMVEIHLGCKDQMNAALHMSEQVRPTPLAAATQGALADIGALIHELR